VHDVQDEDVAIKKTQRYDSSNLQEDMNQEAYIMSSCKHPNIAIIYGLCLDPSTEMLMMVMKHYKHGSLKDTLEHNPTLLTLPIKMQLALDIARAMAYLHCR
jgi:serine/threonine protein kinase